MLVINEIVGTLEQHLRLRNFSRLISLKSWRCPKHADAMRFLLEKEGDDLTLSLSLYIYALSLYIYMHVAWAQKCDFWIHPITEIESG